MSYHPADPSQSAERVYVDTSQYLMGVGGLGESTQQQVNESEMPLPMSAVRTVDLIQAPVASDADLYALKIDATSELPPNRTWAYGPWIPNEGPIPRTVALDYLQSPVPNVMTLGQWVNGMALGLITGTPYYIVLAFVNGSRVLYALTHEEYLALPPNTYQTVMFAMRAPVDAATCQAAGIAYKPGPWANPGTVPSSGWGVPALPGALPSFQWPWQTGGSNTTPKPQPQPSAAGAVGTGTKVAVAVAAVGIGWWLFGGKLGR